MTWERALEADARLAAKNSVLIRAALRQSFDPERAFIGYQNTTPDDSLNLPQQRSRARSWAIMNIRPNLEPLRQILIKVWAEAYALGDTAAREAIEEQKRLQKADTQSLVDWSKWKPGDAAQAIILKPPRAFQRLLEGAGITLKGFSDTTLTDIGNAIGEAIELGLDAKRSAKLIGNHVASAARALTIAITEQNRAISTATQNRYLDAGLKEQTWLVFEPCKICAQNAGQKVSIGAPFASGNTQPPAHPNCRCALAPVIPGFNDPANTAGVITEPIITPDEQLLTPPMTASQAPQTWTAIDRDRWLERHREIRAGISIGPLNDVQEKIAIQQFNDMKVIYEQGPVALAVDARLTKVEDVHIRKVLENIDQVYAKIPEWRKFDANGVPRKITFIVAPGVEGRTGSTLAYTYLGHDTIWLSSKDVRSSIEPVRKPAVPPAVPVQQWSMQVASEVENENLYTLAHEFGHIVDSHANDDSRGRFVGGLRRRIKNPVLWSRYGKKNPKEAYAEAFAQWALGEKTPVTDAFSKEYGWY
ncbi:MAG: phage minor head protein, partial [Bacteroidota bacterium]